ncbi:MAG: DUF1634 domain-containing protein [Anaerolineae bacterium]|nr:DUF1634 domain-containing protein [Anaerolineae bacterium]
MTTAGARGRDHGALGDSLHCGLRTILQWGTAVALALTLVGVVLKASAGQPEWGAAMAMPLSELFGRGALLTIEGMLNLGLLALLTTPVLCVVLAAIWFVLRREWGYGAVSLAVLVVIATSLLTSP